MMSGNSVNKLYGSSGAIWRPLINYPTRSSLLFFFFLSLLLGAFLSTRFLDVSPIVESSIKQTTITGKIISSYIPPDNITSTTTKEQEFDHPPAPTVLTGETIGSLTQPDIKITQTTKKVLPKSEFPLACSSGNITQTCPTNYPKKFELDPDAPPPPTCPEYFRWIYEDLRPWNRTGITREMVERARKTANFRLVILNGKAYVETYQKSWQTRDIFTIWGILQLLRKYPGEVPDLELMFDCVDWPVLLSKFFSGPKAPAPPPLFRYCKDDSTLDIVFPDWSFWGWAEIYIKPWDLISKELKEGNKKVSWMEREPYAYWKGNPYVAPSRMDLLKCNVSEKQDWHARVYVQDWGKEAQQGFKQSNLASQCVHRYKIYIEGSAWSVSEKYILACDSVSLIVKPKYYDFFSRGLMPIEHYWPVRDEDKCRSIKFAVEWGDSHKQKAQAIGKAASDYMQEDLKMDYVYDYMLHLLKEYAKLFTYKPTISKNAVEYCSETMACKLLDEEREFISQSLVKSPSNTAPCTMPPPYSHVELATQRRRKANALRQVENWEKKYYDEQSKQQ